MKIPDRSPLKATQSFDSDYIKDRALGMNEGVVGLIATQKRPLAVMDVLQEPRFKEKEMAWNRAGFHARSSLAGP